VQDWDEEAEEDEATVEKELARVQPEIKEASTRARIHHEKASHRSMR
jgi:ribosomal protein S20